MFGSKTIVISLIVICLMVISLIIGVYISWNNFTPPENSSNDNPPIGSEEHPDNLIIAGNANVAFDFLDNDSYKPVGRDTALFGEDKTWTPGQAKVVYLRITNNGESEINYSLGLNIVDEKGSVNKADQEFKLSDYLQFGFAEDYDPSGDTNIIDALSATDGVKSGVSRVGALTAEDNVVTLALVVYLPESAAEAVDIFAGRATPEIALGVTLMVSQPMNGGNSGVATKPDSFTASAPVADAVTDGVLSTPVTIGGGQSMSATLPEGVKLEDGATEVTLSVNNVESSEANITLGETEAQLSLDVHIAGIAADNTTPMEIVLSGVAAKGLNSTNIKLYHVENGETIEMTQVALADEFSEHNQFKYDPAMGDIALNIASFSEIAVVSDTVNPWDGKSANSFNGGTGTEADPYVIANAGQLAFFRDVVDGKVSWDGDATFKGQYVVLACDIILNHQGEISNQFDPIGWGYDYSGYNRDGLAGKTFNGTFDGQGHVINGLYQNGWDLESTTGTDYTYTNCGGGLFAAVCDATIKNLNVIGANVVYECVEIGIVAGLAQGSCTFENISVYNAKIANYQRPAGGIVGEVSPKLTADGTPVASTHTFKNIVIDTSVTVGSLWGDFDAPVGGVIGARWDDTNVVKVVMDTVRVACRLDVYNDVTSTYQWYAYRRAGMLIGNTEQTAAREGGGTVAAADFLTCTNVQVYYGNWAKYNYCQFTNHNSSWPWVRVQVGENCTAYSNPRYGVPNDPVTGQPVTGFPHNHVAGDQCNVELPFNQLYGGGQGVYGQPEHEGVTFVKYLITFMHDDHIADIQFVTDNSQPHKVVFPEMEDLADVNYTWINYIGEEVIPGQETVAAGNVRDVFYYVNEIDTYYARFVDVDGIQIAAIEFNPNTGKFLYGSEPAVPEVAGYYGKWEPYTLRDATSDIIINPVYSINQDVEILTMSTADDLFRYLEEGKSVGMSQDLTGAASNASKNIFCNLTNGVTARLDLNSFTLEYDEDSNANKDWTLFKLDSGSRLTIGDGLAGYGTLTFHLNKLNSNSSPCLFDLTGGGVLILERGVTIELSYPNANAVTIFNGISDLSVYSGMTVTTTTEGGVTTTRIVVTANTVITTSSNPSFE